MYVILSVIAGLMLGSFLSVLLERLPNGKEGIVAGRSECPQCRHILAWYDLVPLFSYLLLRGKCRYCHNGISALYPALELTIATVFGLQVYLHGLPSTWAVIDMAVLFGLVAMFFFDIKYQILPDIITAAMIILVAVRLLLLRPDLLASGIATAVGLAAFFGLLYAISHGRWLGLGDVKMAALIGLLFGYPGAVGVTIIAIWLGALFGVFLLLVRKAHLTTALPFGSFWAFVAVVAIIWPGPIYFISGLITPALT